MVNLFSILHAPVDTNGYYIAGYSVFFVVMALYLGSLYIRNRNLREEYELLIDHEGEE